MLTELRRSIAGWIAPRAAADFDAATAGRRLRAWNPANTGINTMVFANAETLRARSRDLGRQNAWASHALDSFVADCVGTGIVPRPDAPAALKDRIQKAWLKWTDESDAHQSTDLYGQQSQICRAVMQDGECFVRVRRRREEDGLSVPLQLQILEADYVPLWKNELLPGGGKICGGIEFNAIGRRVAYHVYRDHPGEAIQQTNGGETARIPASEIIHAFRPIRPGQIRGLPWFTPVMIKLHELDQCDDAALVRMKIANLKSIYIKSGVSDTTTYGETDMGDGTAEVGLEPGSIFRLEEGEEPFETSPPDAGGNYNQFIVSHLRAVAAGLGITYESLTGDYSMVNYSSDRGARLQFRRWCEQFQHQTMVWQVCRPVWTAFLQQAVLGGSLPASAIGAAATWNPPAWPWVDPEKDISAAQAEVRAGFNSRSNIVSARGMDSEAIDREQAADNARADAANLKYDSDGRQAASPKAAPQPSAQPQAEPKPGGGKEVVQ